MRWMRLLNRFFQVVDSAQLTAWTYGTLLDKQSFKESPRLRRYFCIGIAEKEYSIQVIIRYFLKQYRALDLGGRGASVFTINLEKVMGLFRAKSGTISQENNEEKNYLDFCDILIKICLNEKNNELVAALFKVLTTSCNTYHNSFAKLL